MTAADFIVADVGGTNTRVALARGRVIEKKSIRRYSNAEFSGLGEVLRQYLDGMPGSGSLRGACAAIAGPVHDGAGHLTNLDWMVDRQVIQSSTGAATISVLNDLQAQGHAIGHLEPGTSTVVREGDSSNGHAAKLVIGVGTGFNVAPVYDTPDGRYVPPAEAGHVSLPVEDEDGLSLARHVARTHGFADVEEVLSGRGIVNVYDWLGEAEGDPRTATAARILESVADGSDPRSEAAMQHFVRVLGIVAGNLALLYLPFGGVYLTGGVARRFGPWLPRMGFEDAFCAKGRFSGFMRQFPVLVVNDDYSALTGCAAHLAQMAAGVESGHT
jgi:glucokinase